MRDGQRRRHRRQPGAPRRCGSPPSRSTTTRATRTSRPIPLTVVVNPVDQPLDDERFENNEGCLSVPESRGNVFRPRQHPGAVPRPGRRAPRGGSRGLDRGHVPARARPPRRRAVRRPGGGPDDAGDLGAIRAPPAGRLRRERIKRWSPASARDRSLVSTYWCEWPGSAARNAAAGVLLDVDGDRLVRGRRRRRPPRRRGRRRLRRPHPAGARQRPLPRLPPGAARAHPRGHRARSGRGGSRCTRSPAPSTRLLPPSGPATYAEMALAGITTVGEFHYLHDGGQHDGRGARRGGGREPGSGSRCSTRATSTAASGRRHGQAKEGVQQRFGDATVDAWAERVTRRRAASADGERWAPPSTACGPSIAGRRRRSWRRAPPSATCRSTPTSASSRPRTTTARPRTDGPRPRSWPTPAR